MSKDFRMNKRFAPVMGGKNLGVLVNLFFQFLFAVGANCGLPHISVIGRSKIAPTQDAYGSGVWDDGNRPAIPIPPPLDGNLKTGVAVLKIPLHFEGVATGIAQLTG